MRRLALLLPCLLFATPAVNALELKWDGELDEKWSSFVDIGCCDFITNWSPNSEVPPGVGDIAAFTGTTANTNVNVDSVITIDALKFDGPLGYTLFNGNVLTLATGNLEASGSATHTISSPTVIGSPGVWDIESGATIDMTSRLAESAITKTGGGTLMLNRSGTVHNTTRLASVLAGDVILSMTNGFNAFGGDLDFAGNNLSHEASNQIPDTSTVTMSAGTYDLVSFNETIDSHYVTGGVTNVEGGTLTLINNFDVKAGGAAQAQLGGTIVSQRNANIDGGTLDILDPASQIIMGTGTSLSGFNNGQLNFAGGRTIANENTYAVSSGADLTVENELNIGGPALRGVLNAFDAGSTVTTGLATTSSWGGGGGTADVNFRFGSTGQFGAIAMAGAALTIVDVESGSQVTTGDLTINGSGTGSIDVFDAGSMFTLRNASALTVGHAFTGNADINITNGGTFNTGAGLTTVNATGTITVGDSGVFNALGDLTINGGQFLRTSSSTANFSFFETPGKLLTVQNGGLFEWGGTNGLLGLRFDNSIVVTGNGSVFRQTDAAGDDERLLVSEAAVDVNNGGELEAEYLALSAGSMTVSGANSLLDVTHGGTAGDVHVIGSGPAGVASLTIEAGANGSFESLLATTLEVGSNNSMGSIDVTTGGSLALQTLDLDQSGTSVVTVDGAGSSISQVGASTAAIGSATGTTSTVNIRNDGLFQTGTGATTVNATGTINLNEGGVYDVRGDLTLDGGRLLSGSSSLNTAQFNLASGVTMTIQNGGLFETSGSNGRLDLDDAGSSIVVTGAGSVLRQSQSGGNNLLLVASGAQLRAELGGKIEAERLLFSSGDITVDGASSSLDATHSFSANETHSLSFDGAATLTLSNDATGSFVSLNGSTLILAPNAGGNATVSVFSGADLSIQSLDMDGIGTSVVTVAGFDSTITQVGNSTTVVGSAAGSSGTINIAGGSTFTTGTGATTVNATGLINMIGSGALTTGGDLTIDGGELLRAGAAFAPDSLTLAAGTTLTIEQGGLFEWGGSNSNLTLDDSGSAVLVTGAGSMFRHINSSAADGTLNITNGVDFDVTSGGTLQGEYLSLNDSALTIDGINTNLDFSSGASEGFEHFITGQLELTDNATGTFASVVPSELNVGFGNAGTVDVLAGSDLTLQNLSIIGVSSGNVSQVTVSGAGSNVTQTGASATNIGEAGDGLGVLSIGSGGTFTTGSGVTAIHVAGRISVNGGTLNAATIDHSHGGVFDFTDGTLRVNTFQGDLTQIGGTLVIGDSPGVTDVTGAYDLQVGALEIELFGNGGGAPVAGVDFDQLTADSVLLAGTLDLIADAGYAPALGDLFPIINTAAGVSGIFSSVSGADLGGGMVFDVIYDPLGVTLQVVLAGDFDVDGDVDGADFLAWQQGDSPVALSGSDLAIWEANYGGVAPMSAPTTMVPEPASVVLIIMATIAFHKRLS